MLDQATQTAETTLKIPWSVAGPAILMFLGQLFLIIRELLKFKDFKEKNGTLNEIKEGIIEIQTNCKAVSGQLVKQTNGNSDEILKLWKEQGKKGG